MATGRSSTAAVGLSAASAGSSAVGRGARRTDQAEAVGLRHQLREAGAGQIRRDDDQRAGQAILGGELIEHGGGVGERAQDRLALDAPAGLRGCGTPAARRRGSPWRRSWRERAQEQVRVLGRADEQDEGGVRRALPRRARRGRATGDRRRAARPEATCRPPPARPERRGWGSRPQAEGGEGEQRGAEARRGGDGGKIADAAKRQYCSDRRNGTPAATSRAAPSGIAQSGGAGRRARRASPPTAPRPPPG